jgi:hypothetical protein
MDGTGNCKIPSMPPLAPAYAEQNNGEILKFYLSEILQLKSDDFNANARQEKSIT